MTQHAEKKWMPYTAEQLFTMVANVEEYPDFLPWCTGVYVRERSQQSILADMSIGYHMFRESFTSHVRLDPYEKIEVAFREGPFRYLNNFWSFENNDQGCTVDFFIDFELKAFALQAMMSVIFEKAAQRMLHAFEKRAHHLYGVQNTPSSSVVR